MDIIIVYLPAVKVKHTGAKPEFIPEVSFAVCDLIADGMANLTNYRMRPLCEIDGIPYKDFTESDWARIPKGMSGCDLTLRNQGRITYHEQEQNLEFLRSASIECPGSLLQLIDLGFLVPMRETLNHIEIQLDHDRKFYRLKKVPVNPRGISEPNAYLIPEDDLITDYNNALKLATERCKAAKIQSLQDLELDFQEDCRYQLFKLPVEDRDRAARILLKLPHDYGFSLRYYKGELLYRSSGGNEYRTIFTASR